MTATAPTAHCSILLLAGGRGQRMGGADKGLIAWHGQPLVAHVQAVVRPLTDDLIISCNRNPERYQAFADHLVSDAQADFPGPLAGVLAGLAKARHPQMLVLACDAPCVDRPLLRSLLALGPRQPAMVREAGQWQPMFSLIPRHLLPALQEAWHQGERSVLRALLPHGLLPLECPAGDPRLVNFNTPALLQAHAP
ncbi:molybdenum cofactor guanylyltransferase MobA [Pseudomonas abieticivorans]|uniref:molybdenum cofactor guanylyltransferase MobA n=1 Tax=Pseudomonas abieticivorans TaxID=2931382 RepID=UPI0020BEF76E|nr:molybdenum cofactor guanylyltransferase MobA [Pseudomonas sp. PIA16]